MANFKVIAVATLLAVTAAVGVAKKADAYQVDFDCGTVGGYEACISYQDRNNPDELLVEGPAGSEYLEVSCYSDGGYDWKSYGPNSKGFNDYIASSFCR